jgi:hypothetical protein
MAGARARAWETSRLQLLNKTPFAAERTVLQDRNGRDLLVVIVKQTFAIRLGEPPVIADEPVPIQAADAYYGEPGESSVRLESDFAPGKPGTDVVLIGHAYAPRGRTEQVDVQLEVGSLRKTCRVTGDRYWRRLLGGLRASAPEPFERMPLVYERAFGGHDVSAKKEKHREMESRNLAGCGLIAKGSKLNVSDVALPNIEDPAQLVTRRKHRPVPAGFGFLCRHWEPRLSYAGTFDAAWEEKRAPLLPTNFDERYHNGAHPDLISQGHLQGGEPVRIENASPHGTLQLTLPRILPRIRLAATRGEPITLQPAFDTLVFEPDEERFTMVWRASYDIHGALLAPMLIQLDADLA